jgi:hypothetical protein
MKPFPAILSASVRILLLSSGLWIGGCRDNPRQAHSGDSAANTASVSQETGEGTASPKDSPSTDGQLTELRREIQARRQNVEDIEAFVQMERAKLEEDPDYDQSFMLDALEEQQELREAIESGENRVEELSAK